MKGAIDKIVGLQRKFLWSGGTSKSFLALTSWDILELPKMLGGLGCGNLLHRNLSLLLKWLWRYLHESHTLLHRIISYKYGYHPIFLHHNLTTPSYGEPWKNICAMILKNPATKIMLQINIRRRVGNGHDTLFWLDQWVGDSSLSSRFPRLLLIASNPQAKISSCGHWEHSSWIWNLHGVETLGFAMWRNGKIFKLFLTQYVYQWIVWTLSHGHSPKTRPS